MTDTHAWQHAHAVQAKADFESHPILRLAPSLPQCLALHSLQVACEKLSGAYLCSQKVEPRFSQASHVLQASHAYTAKSLPEMFFAQRARNVVVPAEYPFTILPLLSEAAGQDLLKIIPFAIDEPL